MNKRSEKALLTNRETGEQAEYDIEFGPKRGFGGATGRGFAMIWWDEVFGLDISAKQLKTLLSLVRIADKRGEARYLLEEIAAETGQRESTAWRCIEFLYDKDIVRRSGRARVIINPNVIWKGSIADRSAAMVRWHNKLDGNTKVVGTVSVYRDASPDLGIPAGWSIPAAIVEDMRGNRIEPGDDGLVTLT